MDIRRYFSSGPNDYLCREASQALQKQPPEVFYKKRCSMPQACNFIKKRLWHRCFPVNFVKFLRTPFLRNNSGRLLPALNLEGPGTASQI